MTDYKVAGKRIPRIDLPDKAAGTARFAADVAAAQALSSLILRSPHPHARIVSINTNAARKIPGVHAVLTGSDCPKHRFGTQIHDLTWLAQDGVVRHVGDAIAAVAAETMDAARTAISAIRVKYETREPVLDPIAARDGKAPLVHEDWREIGLGPGGEGNVIAHYERTMGDVDSALASADRIFEHTFRTPYAHSGYIEPHACMAEAHADGKITIWTSTQAPFAIREQAAEALGLPFTKIRVIPTEIGGGFGGKIHSYIEHIVALLALKTGRPVRHEMTREDDHNVVSPRQSLNIRLKTGIKNDGTIIGREADVTMDHGAYGPSAIQQGSSRIPMFTSCYNIPNVRVTFSSVYTNGPICGSVRGPSGPQCYFATEVHLDIIAREMGIDPVEIRLKNGLRPGDAGLFGTQRDDGMIKVVERAAESGNWGAPIETGGPLDGPGWKLGRGFAVGFWRGNGGASSCTARLNADGTIQLLSGSVNLTGATTSMCQIAAEEMGIDIEKFSFESGDTDTAPESVRAAGSMVTRSMGAAVLLAVRNLKEKIFAVAAEKLEADAEDLEWGEGKVFVSAAPDRSMTFDEVAQAAPGVAGYILGQAETPAPDPCPIYSAQVAEVAVNPDLGEVKVLRLTCAQDVGFAINPTSVQGQMEGGMLQGMGLALMEEQPRDEKGNIYGGSLHEYLLPTSMDLPEIKTVTVENPAEDTPYGIRGVGEPPILATPAAIINAISDATGARFFEMPVAPHQIRAATEIIA